MQDLIDNLSEAFKARDLGAVRRKRATVVVHGDPDLLALWVSYEAILSRHADEQSWHSAYLGMCAKGEEDAAPHLARSSVLLATLPKHSLAQTSPCPPRFRVDGVPRAPCSAGACR